MNEYARLQNQFFNNYLQCLEGLEQWQTNLTESPTVTAETLTDVEELTILLTSYEMEGLLLAHDSIASFVEGMQTKQSSPEGDRSSPNSSCRESRIAENIKIIRIDKTNEPLGATVRNEGEAVVIGNYKYCLEILIFGFLEFNIHF